jgi:hypothetical protein
MEIERLTIERARRKRTGLFFGPNGRASSLPDLPMSAITIFHDKSRWTLRPFTIILLKIPKKREFLPKDCLMRIAHYSIPRQLTASRAGAIGVGRVRGTRSGMPLLSGATFPGGEAYA